MNRQGHSLGTPYRGSPFHCSSARHQRHAVQDTRIFVCDHKPHISNTDQGDTACPEPVDDQMSLINTDVRVLSRGDQPLQPDGSQTWLNDLASLYRAGRFRFAPAVGQE